MVTSQPDRDTPERTTGADGPNTQSPRATIACAKRLGRALAFRPVGRAGASLAANLVVLVAVVALPLMILGAGALWLQYLNERTAAETRLVEHTRSIALLVDRAFERTRLVAETLAAAVPVAGGDLNAIEGELRAARGLLAANSPARSAQPIITLMDAHGAWLLHTEWAPGERRTGLYGTPLGRAAVAEGRPKISDLFVGPSTGIPLVGLAVPVFAPAPAAGGRRDVIGGIGISIPRGQLIAIVNEAGVPPGGSVSVLDRKGVFVARSVRDAESVGKLSAPAVLEAILASEYGIAPLGTMSLDKVPSLVAFARAPDTGYILRIDVPDQVFLAPLRGALLRSAAVAILVFAGGLALAILAAQRIVRAFGIALGTATQIGVTAGPAVKSTGLKTARLSLQSGTFPIQNLFFQFPMYSCGGLWSCRQLLPPA